MLVNLVGNAIKFTERGEVVLEVAACGLACASSSDDAHAKPQAAIQLQFSVSDTGIGIPREKQQMIFDPFAQVDSGTTRKYGGSGLGLTISARLVEMMGGRMTVESERDRGSTFRFTLPVQSSSTAPPRPVQPERVRGLSVLIVDDNATNRRILEETLTGWEMRPTCVAAGDAALAALTEAQRAGTPFALVLLDAQMPADGRLHAGGANPSPARAGGGDGHDALVGGAAGQHGASPRNGHHHAPDKAHQAGGAVESDPCGAGPGPSGTHTNRRAGSACRATAGRACPRTTHLRILLAEDNPFNQKLAQGLLGKEGHSLVIVSNGAEALAALDREEFDIVLMDVQMPEMDGYPGDAADP